jgi:hypothetical protein
MMIEMMNGNMTSVVSEISSKQRDKFKLDYERSTKIRAFRVFVESKSLESNPRIKDIS